MKLGVALAGWKPAIHSTFKGCDFTYRNDANTPKVLLINERMAKKYWKDENPIGQQLNIRYGTGTIVHEIVGIVGNVKHFGLDQDAPPEMYMPFYQVPDFFLYLVV